MDNCGQAFQDRSVFEQRRHPSLADVAILVLSTDVLSNFALAIPDVRSPSYLSRIKKGDDMLMVGAGLTRTGSREQFLAERVRTLRLQLLYKNHTRCGSDINNEEVRERRVSDSIVCSVSNQGSPCRGDSGAPILLADNADSGGDVIVAIHSLGPRNCSGADEDSEFGHVAMSRVADFVFSVICSGDKQEMWCTSTFASPSSPPAKIQPTTEVPSSLAPTTLQPTTKVPSSLPTTNLPSSLPTTKVPSSLPTTELPTSLPTTEVPSSLAPTTPQPTTEPSSSPTKKNTSSHVSSPPSFQPTASLSPPSSLEPSPNTDDTRPPLPSYEEEKEQESETSGKLWPVAVAVGVGVAAAIAIILWKCRGSHSENEQGGLADDLAEYAKSSLPSIQRKCRQRLQQQQQRE